MDPKQILGGLGILLVAYFLYRLFSGTASRTLAIPPAIAAGLGLLSVDAHPLVALVGGFVVFSLVSKVILFSIRWAATIVVIALAGVVGYGLHTGQLHL